MYEIKENDLQLSEKFKTANLNLEYKKQEIILANKKENNDTIEASLLFLSHKAYFKEKHKNTLVIEKKQQIKRELIKSFPKLNENTINLLLTKHGFFTYKELVSVLIIILSGLFILLSCTLFFMFNLTVNIILPLLAVFIILFLFLDTYITRLR